ncbi:hypothetical protein GON26_11590 [Flavobacterium sp. GA093]|uniref:Endonuclease G n=1 Tax=Flavobacterium hydrocarbonoxydans TaxID=2683249 RepID=A0A6I4NKT8_9FLAO|nr:DNA/RNA non-specific endonuclease [Flavobacterium hydrocarbonoxydans]MWB95010.1 hypothetical protein [Flavobacterium hydrocarbonoxydans]
MAVFNSRDLSVLKSSCGYIDTFIDGSTVVGIDKILTSEQRKVLPDVDGNASQLLRYTMLSIWYNKERKVPFLAAYNIDGSLKRTGANRVQFKDDPRISASLQLNNSFYNLIYNSKETEFEIGHMASHNEMAWGLKKEIQAEQTFHFTNSVPQVEKLNSGLWSKLESYVITETNESDNKRISVFTGPMIADDDPTYVKDRSFQLPLFFFKIVVFSFEGKLYSTAFVMSQLKRLRELELIDAPVTGYEKGFVLPKPFSDYKHKEVFQVNIQKIEAYTGLNFHWDNVEPLNIEEDERKIYKIAQTGGKLKNKLANNNTYNSVPILTNMVLPGRNNILF